MTRHERRRLGLDVERPGPVVYSEPEKEEEEPVQLVGALPRRILRQMDRFEKEQERAESPREASLHRIRKVMRRRSHGATRKPFPWHLVIGAGFTGEVKASIPDKAKPVKNGKAYKVFTYGLNELVWEDHPRRPGVKRLVSKAPKRNYEIIRLPEPRKVEAIGRVVYLHKEDVRDGNGEIVEQIREWRPGVAHRY